MGEPLPLSCATKISKQGWPVAIVKDIEETGSLSGEASCCLISLKGGAMAGLEDILVKTVVSFVVTCRYKLVSTAKIVPDAINTIHKHKHFQKRCFFLYLSEGTT